jgi:hypothetical protein
VGLRGLGRRLVPPAVLRLLGGYPYYYPHYPTYGYGARYNPRTGTYSRGAAAWGPYGARGYGEAYNPRTGAYGRTRQGSNVYGSWGTTSVQRGDQWATTARHTSNVTGRTTRATRTSEGGAAVSSRGPGGSARAVRTGSGDVYAGRDGNVYRQQDGGWQKYDNGSWGNVDRPQTTTRDGSAARDGAQASRSRSGTTGPPAPTAYSGGGSSTVDQLNRDSRARSEGAQRTRDYGSYQRSGGGYSGASSYRSGGGSRGGMRGGGRRR